MLFEPTAKHRLFGLPPGADFPAELVRGLLERTQGWPPEQIARIHLLVNTRRMQRRLIQLFVDGSARLLPRIGLITDVRSLLPTTPLPPGMPPIRRHLELLRLVEPLLGRDGALPKSAGVELAESLAALLDEMQGEGIDPSALTSLRMDGMSEHWEKSVQFLAIINQYVRETSDLGLDPEALRRHAIDTLIARWSTNPPTTPIIIAGSTGSRATTRKLMNAVAALPQGALLLPGFDPDLPTDTWRTIKEEDHPQYRFAALLEELDAAPSDVSAWRTPPRNPRTALISLSLRPAPVTHSWRTEGPGLGDLRDATKGMTLIEASKPRDEALAIAVAMRKAVENKETVALITPDRNLSRRVASALLRWNIRADDSAGRPLSLTPPGRLLRHVGRMIGADVAPADLIALLTHPLVASGGKGRAAHGLNTQRLELSLRKAAVRTVGEHQLNEKSAGDSDWRHWIAEMCRRLQATPPTGFAQCLQRHVSLAEALAAGPEGDGSGDLWDAAEGRDVRRLIDTAALEDTAATDLSFGDYLRLIETLLAQGSTRAGEDSRPDVMIWGTLEARVQGADVVILSGLNEGTWPERPAPDPWLNRSLRKQLGLLAPEREVGLSAHDYQQAVSAPRVILSRALRDDDADSVQSRWLSRLLNLLEGLPDQHGQDALEQMREAGQVLMAEARALETPETETVSEVRPCPSPPISVRPKEINVTEIQTLIRDPYAVYARRVLGLEKLMPLSPEPDARLRGILFHKIMQTAFGVNWDIDDHQTAAHHLTRIGLEKIAKHVPWKATAEFWAGHLASITDHVVSEELVRRGIAKTIATERKGRHTLPGMQLVLNGNADRIDRLHDDSLVIYDYKTGKPPSQKKMAALDVQLPVEAVMAEAGAFQDVPASKVAYVAHIGLGRSPATQRTDLIGHFDTATIARHLEQLLSRHHEPTQGYLSRRAADADRPGDYDHLARFGEWDDSMDPITQPVS